MTRNQTTLLIILILGLSAYNLQAYDLPRWFPFNEKNALKGWEEKIFKNRVLYVIETKKNQGFLSATSDKACSGLVYKLKFNAKESPLMSWKWQVQEFPEKINTGAADSVDGSRPGWVEKDDYAARVYVIFPSWNFMNIKSLEYVWDDDLPPETIITSPFSANIKLIVAESGKTNLNQWVFEERNIYEDYKKAFGKAGNITVGMIALMTDSDNSISTAEASYKDLKIGYTK